MISRHFDLQCAHPTPANRDYSSPRLRPQPPRRAEREAALGRHRQSFRQRTTKSRTRNHVLLLAPGVIQIVEVDVLAIAVDPRCDEAKAIELRTVCLVTGA